MVKSSILAASYAGSLSPHNRAVFITAIQHIPLKSFAGFPALRKIQGISAVFLFPQQIRK